MKDHSGAKRSGLKMGLLAVTWDMIISKFQDSYFYDL